MSKHFNPDGRTDLFAAYIVQFGKRIREERLRRGWPIDVLAAQTGVGESHLGYIERGQQPPTLYTMVKISEGLGIPLATLLSNIEHEHFHATRAPGQDAQWYALV